MQYFASLAPGCDGGRAYAAFAAFCRLVIADPINACSAIQTPRLAGAVVVVQRGECPFFEKAMQVQKQGGRGVLILNNQPKVREGEAESCIN